MVVAWHGSCIWCEDRNLLGKMQSFKQARSVGPERCSQGYEGPDTRGEGGREDGLGVGQKVHETDRASRKVP